MFKFWIRLGTHLQLFVICTLFLALSASVAAIMQASWSTSSSSDNMPFTLLAPPPTPTPSPVFVFPEWDEEFALEIIDSRPLSLLTGFHVDEEYATRRPIAVVINNSPGAHPQSGITEADIVYEVLAEGNTTRLVAIFQSSIPEKIGPVRSARDYFVDFALNHDAFFVHHGGSPTGYQRIRSLLGINAIDGMRFEGTVFWRDRSFPEWTGNTNRRAIEHSSYTGYMHLMAHKYSLDIRDSFADQNPEYGFSFGDVPLDVASLYSSVHNVVIPYSSAVFTSFEMDFYTGLYKVSHQNGLWQDATTQEQVSIANILIQHTIIRVIDEEGRRSVTTVGSGSGYLVRGGYVFNVLWEKNSHTSPMRWFFEDGTPLVLAPGRTWINVLQTSALPEFNAGYQEDSLI